MGLFTPGDNSEDYRYRQTGFRRYRQLLSFYAGNWFRIGLFTVAGAIPLATGIVFSILSSSVLVLLPCSVAGGMIFGPFLAGLFDSILRGLRDDPNNWWSNYKKSWKQNWKGSLLPGALLGLFIGLYCFMAYIFWVSERGPSHGTIALYLFSGLLAILLNTLYWPQMVLFRQTLVNRLRNIILFTAKYLWKVLGATVLQMAYFAIMVLFAPWTLLLVPLLGIWYILFLSQFILYDALNQELQIEEQYTPINGSYWDAEEEEDEDFDE